MNKMLKNNVNPEEEMSWENIAQFLQKNIAIEQTTGLIAAAPKIEPYEKTALTGQEVK
jgi:hypothetical protein